MARYAGKTKDVQINALTALFGGATLRLYDALPAATFGQAPAGVVLAEYVIPTPSHEQSQNGEGSADLVGDWYDPQANASGQARGFTITDAGGILQDGTCGLAGSNADMILQDVNILQNRGFRVTRFTFQF